MRLLLLAALAAPLLAGPAWAGGGDVLRPHAKRLEARLSGRCAGADLACAARLRELSERAQRRCSLVAEAHGAQTGLRCLEEAMRSVPLPAAPAAPVARRHGTGGPTPGLPASGPTRR